MSLLLRDYDYHLPEELIAQTPLEDRAASRLFLLPHDGSPFEHRQFREVPSLLRPDDLLVVNDTRVTARRLHGHRAGTGGAIELLLLSELSPGSFIAMAKPGRRLRPGSEIEFEDGARANVVAELEDGLKQVEIHSGEGWIDRVGKVPLPPYIGAQLMNPERYQTVYATHGGSAAAPTAGLHFTPEILEQVREMGVQTARVTLDVSIDTFRPVAVNDLKDHVMHGETCRISPESAAQINAARGRIIAVGTTSVRTLESFAAGGRKVDSGEMVSKLFIYPGFDYQVIDGMFTNFHLPKTTMMLMLSALVGRERLLEAYEEAVRERYRFLSFGDSMLIC
jgi:S-adenosylmethionine:tRNA ribosyltransferase-isomerase